MVRFVGGPTVSAYKDYNNHRVARPGQWRNLRNYGSVTNNTKIVIRNYNYCNHSAAPRMPWFARIPILGGLLLSLINVLKPTPPVVTPEPEPETKIEETPDNKGKGSGVVEVKPDVATEIVSNTVEEPGEKITETIEYTVAEGKQKTITLTGNEREAAIKKFGLTGDAATKAVVTKAPLWGTLAKCYGCKNDAAFREAFKAECNKLGIMEGDGLVHNHKIDQNFPKEITVNGTKYQYQSGVYSNQENWDVSYYIPNENSSSYKTYGTNEKKETKEKAGTPTQKTTFTATTKIWTTDTNGDGKIDKKDTATHTKTATGTTEKEAKDKLTAEIKGLNLGADLTKLATDNIFATELEKKDK